MPTYEYQCDACEHNFDEFQSFSDAPLKKCPKCKKMKLRRVFGAGVAIIFKGSGFYETDYRSDSYKKAAEADKKAASGDSDSKKSESSNGKKTDTKKAKSNGSSKGEPKSAKAPKPSP